MGFYDLPQFIQTIYGSPLRVLDITARRRKGNDTISVTGIDDLRLTWTDMPGKGWVMTGEKFVGGN